MTAPENTAPERDARPFSGGEAPPRTSINSPLRIDEIEMPGGGKIGMSLCPGKHATTSISGAGWARDLETDVAAVHAWGATHFVTLMEVWELAHYQVPRMGEAVSRAGMQWHHLPIVDGAAPDAEWDERWATEMPILLAALLRGENIFIHCLGGRGRTGTAAVLLLMARGTSYQQALDWVRRSREGAVETEAQEVYLRNWDECRIDWPMP